MLKTNSEWYEVDNFFFLASGRAHSLLQKYDHEYVVYFETFVIFLWRSLFFFFNFNRKRKDIYDLLQSHESSDVFSKYLAS